jgi:bifunctional DNA-binding transcriptional regulator/antitoxin component of YhaV-PrlF toxin-antitoxin module
VGRTPPSARDPLVALWCRRWGLNTEEESEAVCLKNAEAKVVRRGEEQLKRGESKPWRAVKPKTEITVPKSIRRKAGFKPGDQVEFKVSKQDHHYRPKLTPDELQDEREIRDQKIRGAIGKSCEEFLAGKCRPIQKLFAGRAARTTGPRRPRG